MINNKKILVMILARSGSTGVKDKNIADLNGRPVLWYSISEAKKSKYADAICVSTDSSVYAKIAEDAGIVVPFLRAPEVSTKQTTAAASSKWSTLKFEEFSNEKYDYIVDFMCTNPFKTVEDLDGCIEKLDTTGADTVVAVNRVWDGHPARIKQIIDDEIQDWPGISEILESLRQDLTPPAYIRCGSVYAMRRHVLIEEGNRRGKVSRPWIMPANRVVNIDEPKDLVTARALMTIQESDKTGKESLAFRVLAISRIEDLTEVMTILSRIGQVDHNSNLKQEELSSIIHNYDVIIVPTHLLFDKSLLLKPSHSRLKVICTPSVGVDHIDTELAKKQNIEVISLQGQSEIMKNVSSPAELAFSLMLAISRKLLPASSHAKEGNWNASIFMGTELMGLTVGIIGFGCVGTIFSEFCRAFRMRILAYDPYKIIHQTNITQYSHLDRLLQESDFISVHASLNNNSYQMLSEPQFELMKSSVYFINTSRGSIVNQRALLQALEKGKIAGAALDVIDGEIESLATPDIIESRNHLIDYARTNDNLILTPHIGGTTQAAREKRAVYMARLLEKSILKNLIKFSHEK